MTTFFANPSTSEMEKLLACAKQLNISAQYTEQSIDLPGIPCVEFEVDSLKDYETILELCGLTQ